MDTYHRPKLIRYHDGDACPVPDCDWIISRDASMTCAGCLGVISSMCRGKARQSEMDARMTAFNRRGRELLAYECVVCESWHTGHDIPDKDQWRQRAAVIKAYMISVYGPYWWKVNVLDKWDPDNGVYSRSYERS